MARWRAGLVWTGVPSRNMSIRGLRFTVHGFRVEAESAGVPFHGCVEGVLSGRV